VRKISVIVSVADDQEVPAGVLSEIHMAFRGIRDVRLEFVVVRQASCSALSMVSDDSDSVVLFDVNGDYSAQDVGKVAARLLSGEVDVVLGTRVKCLSRTVMVGLKLPAPALKVVEFPISSRSEGSAA
jgi:hypothetical protein